MSIYLVCKICQKNYGNIRAIAQHVSSHKHTSKTYYDTYFKCESDGYCSCGKATKWLNLSLGYAKKCRKCAASACAKDQWSGDEGLKRKALLSEKMQNNTFSIGRQKCSKNKNKYHIESVYKRLLNNPMPSWKGKKHSKSTKVKMTEAAYKRIERIGLPMPSYKGRFTPKYPQKYKGDPTNIIFRSLWERRVMRDLDENTNVLSWQSEELFIRYYDPTTMKYRRYFPDFVVTVRQKDGNIKTLMLEVKPKNQTIEPKIQTKKTKRYITEVTTWATNQAKWQAAREYCLDRGWDFKIITEDHLGIK